MTPATGFCLFIVQYCAQMPPKAKPAPSKKTDQKKKEKIIEDKTFGLKNKKGAKQQKFIQQVQHQVKFGGNASTRKVEESKKTDNKKDDKKKEQAELNQLFKPVTTQKVEKGADPKSVLCAFYKQGQCSKGDKCKFSHDLSLERKAEKRSVYVDMRDDNDNMENWDEAKLKEVVEKKHAEADSKKLKTEIICKFFLDALERNKYGWFWECPNGERCIYRHALPPGFVLNKDKKKDEKKEEISIEDLVERERALLGHSLTKITLESFMAWKKKKIAEKEMNKKKDDARKEAAYKAGKSIGLSGREMFTFNPEMAVEDETEEGEMTYDTSNLPPENEDEVQDVYELTLEQLAAVAQESDGTGTVSLSSLRAGEPYVNDNCDARIEGAVGGEARTSEEEQGDIPIDENLFVEDEDDDDDDNEEEDDDDDLSN